MFIDTLAQRTLLRSFELHCFLIIKSHVLMKQKEAPIGYKYIFTRSIRRKGKIVYHPKGGMFVFLVKEK